MCTNNIRLLDIFNNLIFVIIMYFLYFFRIQNLDL